MKFGERMAVVEVKLTNIQKWLYILTAAFAARLGIEVVPTVTAYLN